jgi:hypothetical protein
MKLVPSLRAAAVVVVRAAAVVAEDLIVTATGIAAARVGEESKAGVFRTKITVTVPGSRANRAGNHCAAIPPVGGSLLTYKKLRRNYGNVEVYVPEAPERNEAPG